VAAVTVLGQHSQAADPQGHHQLALGAVVLQQVSVRFGALTALADISLVLREKRIGIVGDNGSGKSTLARLINGLAVPSAGTVTVLGRDTVRDGDKVRRHVGFIFQNPETQLVMPTVAEDLALGLKAHGIPKAQHGERIAAVLAALGIVDLRDRACGDLSGGEKQLVALAGVLVLEPAILVCDEPTAMLDRRHTRMLMSVLSQLPQQVILVTHQTGLLHDFDRVIALDAGRVVDDGPPQGVIPRYLERTA
jgi:biotin transport system ATP-binding protein